MNKQHMAEANETIPEPVLESLKRSGFPFQTAVADVIRRSKGWSVHASEYPWRGPENDDRFLDLVATNNKFVLTVECKKTRQEILTFLRPLGGPASTGDVDEFRCLRVVEYYPIQRFVNVVCETLALWPRSPSCEFCIVSTSSSGKDQRLLERDASILIGATDVFAEDVQENIRVSQNLRTPFPVLPVIVTNAKLYTARYDPTQVSLETGEFEETPEEIDSAPWVRFSKIFVAGRGRDLGSRAIFVVNSIWLGEFLSNLELSPEQPQDRLSVSLR
jgi:hypothetical protein